MRSPCTDLGQIVYPDWVPPVIPIPPYVLPPSTPNGPPPQPLPPLPPELPQPPPQPAPPYQPPAWPEPEKKETDWKLPAAIIGAGAIVAVAFVVTR